MVVLPLADALTVTDEVVDPVTVWFPSSVGGDWKDYQHKISNLLQQEIKNVANRILNTSSCFFVVESGSGTVRAKVGSAIVNVKEQTQIDITKKTHFLESSTPYIKTVPKVY